MLNSPMCVADSSVTLPGQGSRGLLASKLRAPEPDMARQASAPAATKALAARLMQGPLGMNIAAADKSEAADHIPAGPGAHACKHCVPAVSMPACDRVLEHCTAHGPEGERGWDSAVPRCL